MSQTIRAFIADCEKETRTATELNRLHIDPVELLQWQKNTMRKTLDNFFIESRYDFYELQDAKKQLKKAKQDLEDLQGQLLMERKQNREMFELSHSRIIRFAIRLRHLYRRLTGKNKAKNKAK